MGGHDENQREIERLDSIARTVYADMRLKQQTPIAVVGSGLSVPYGGISWSKATKEGLDEALRQVNLAEQSWKDAPHTSSKSHNLARIGRARRSIKAYKSKDAIGSDEQYLAMQIAKDGIDTAHACVAEIYRDKLGDDFKGFMARLFGKERFRLAREMQTRIVGSIKQPLNKDIKNHLYSNTDKEFDEVLARFYSFDMLVYILPDQRFDGIIDRLKATYQTETSNNLTTLPPDRRSLVALFLAVRRGYDNKFNASAIWKAFAGVEHQGPSCLRPLDDPIREIHEKLGIQRFITLNYDHELERALMFDDVRAIKGAHYGFDDALSDMVLHGDPAPLNGGTSTTAGVKRRLSDGLTASSEIYQASAVANLFEFALNSPDFPIQIVHQHGRADVPESMVLTDDDLNRVYRHNNYSRTTLEQALDVILTGNPILFIGLGLNEPEITRPLRQLVGEGRAALDDPAFAIMVFDGSKGDKGYEKDGGVNAWRRQFGLFRQYGIHLFDAGHPRHGNGAFNRKVSALDAFIKAINPDKNSRINSSKNQRKSLKNVIEECRNSDVAKDIMLDDLAFDWLLSGIESGNIIVNRRNFHLFEDYLNYLISKHYTQCLIHEIRRLEKQVLNRFAETTYQNIEGLGFAESRTVQDGDVREAGKPNFRSTSVRHAIQFATEPQFPKQIGTAIEEIMCSIEHNGATFLVGEMGSGKGAILSGVRKRLDKLDSPQYCYINCAMALEFDSAIFQILMFTHGVASSKEGAPLKDRLNDLRSALMKGVPLGNHPPLIVISGIERLLDAQSKALTPEIELITKMLLHPDVLKKGWHVLIAGTESAINWVEQVSTGIRIPYHPKKVLLSKSYGGLLIQIWDYVHKHAQSEKLKSKIDDWKLYPKAPYVPNGARSPASSWLISLVLKHWHEIIPLSGNSPSETRACAELDRQILQNLAYVGQPVGRSVLLSMPDISRAAQNTSCSNDDAVIASCQRLVAAGLAMDVLPFPYGQKDKSNNGSLFRLALPRTVLAELRERAGVRSGEEQLSNSFTLTLAASMPTDLVLPDQDVSQTLAQTVGHLRAAWKDGILEPGAAATIAYLKALGGSPSEELAPLLAEKAGQVECVERVERLALMASVPMNEALRAAAAIVRGFFSAATLVSTDPSSGSLDNGVRAQFEQHRKRVDRLLERTREVQRLSEQMRHELIALGVDRQLIDDCIKALVGGQPRDNKAGADNKEAALYSGELIWLLNEAGVIALLQGNLRAAERSFREAENARVRFKGLGSHHTWRRLVINQAFLRIERGRIAEARSQLSHLETVIDEPRLKIGNDAIRANNDDLICKPIIIGYLGLVDALGGHLEIARRRYKYAIRGLIDSGQQRALALFYWRLGSLALSMPDRDDARHYLNLAIAEAESALQIDVVWRARLTMTELQRETDPAFVATVFREARQYAETMKVPRVQVTALRREAEWRMEREDLTVAAALTTQAMQHAKRNGMTLMLISLRTLMGSIMVRQGDASGEFLLQRAIRHADRVGYQLEVNKARNALLGIKVAARH